MLFKLSDLDMSKMRFELYPQDFFMKNALVKTSGTDTIIDTTIFVRDFILSPDLPNANKLPTSRVFANSKVKNTLRFKIFQIVNPQMLGELSNVIEVGTIDRIIAKYGALTYDLFPCIDYKGTKKESDSELTLNYNVKFSFSNTELKFLSYGMIFYFSMEDFVSLKGISPKYVKKEVLSSNLQIVNLLDTNGAIINGIVQDIRTINRTFKSAEALDKLNDTINFNYKTTKNLSQNSKKVPNDQFFSKLYTSRDQQGNANLLFNLDFKKIVQNYSNFSTIIKNTPFPGDIDRKCKIASLKIVRRHINYDSENKKKNYIKNLPVEVVASTSQTLDDLQYALQQVSTEKSVIRENGLFPNLRTIEVVDKTAYDYRSTAFQYGIQMSVSDGYYKYLYSTRDVLLDQIRVFKEYLLETQKYLNPITGEGYYDPQTQDFTRKFVLEVFPVKYEQRIKISLSALINSMKLFGLFETNKQTTTVSNKDNLNVAPQDIIFDPNSYEQQTLSSLVSLIKPEFATDTTIQYLISVYQRFINQINTVIKDVSNTTFDIEHWFNQIVDASERPDIGYGFFNLNRPFNGLARVRNADLEAKSAKDVYEYIKDNKLDSERAEYRYSSVGPEFINAQTTKIQLKDIINIKNDIFMDLELEIKRLLLLGDEEKEMFLDDSISTKTTANQGSGSASVIEMYRKNSATSLAFGKFSGFLNNLNNTLSDYSKTFAVGKQDATVPNTDVNPRLLFLAMLKNVDKKPVIRRMNNEFRRPSATSVVIANEHPFQISSLVANKDPYFAPDKIDYLSDLKYNSKFLFLYNTLHRVEILLPTDNVKNENWQLLTNTIYKALPAGSKFLCRLKLYTSNEYNANLFKAISLPIYDEHFILDLNATPKEIDDLLTKLSQTYAAAIFSRQTLIDLDDKRPAPVTTDPAVSTTNIARQTADSVAESYYPGSSFSLADKLQKQRQQITPASSQGGLTLQEKIDIATVSTPIAAPELKNILAATAVTYDNSANKTISGMVGALNKAGINVGGTIPPAAPKNPNPSNPNASAPQQSLTANLQSSSKTTFAGAVAAGAVASLPAPRPNIPTAFTVIAKGITNIKIDWVDTQSGVTYYKLERAEGTGSFASINAPIATVRTYEDTSVKPATSYKYRLKAVSASGESDWTEIKAATTLNRAPIQQPPRPAAQPKIPTSFMAAAVDFSTVKISWVDAQSDIKSYVLERAVGNGNFVAISSPSAPTRTYNDTTVAASTAYKYRIKAVTNTGDSAWSEVKAITTPARPFNGIPGLGNIRK